MTFYDFIITNTIFKEKAYKCIFILLIKIKEIFYLYLLAVQWFITLKLYIYIYITLDLHIYRIDRATVDNFVRNRNIFKCSQSKCMQNM